ncbi:hypothetical protein LTR53_011429 [Teratosphaeriaceae sp. CCFEE 6253]|nr:hypothetical protein LTR53_011429 [Teratosphaeriaceae sp. CCFEE 6253]
MEPFIQSLQSSRDIKVVVGTEEQKTFFVQQGLLESTSEYFVKALKSQHLGKIPGPGFLKFPEDDVAPWELLLFWIYRGTYNNKPFTCTAKEGMALAVAAWALGDRLCIPDFQNQVRAPSAAESAKASADPRRSTSQAMLALLRAMEIANISIDVVQQAVDSSAPKSSMRALMADEIILQLHEGQIGPYALEELDGRSFLCAVLDRQQLKSDGGVSDYDRGLRLVSVEDYEKINEYMVGSGLKEPRTS